MAAWGGDEYGSGVAWPESACSAPCYRGAGPSRFICVCLGTAVSAFSCVFHGGTEKPLALGCITCG